MNKYDELCIFASVYKPDLICVSESWLNRDMDDYLLSLTDYTILRDYGRDRIGGGVCAWIQNRFSSRLLIPKSDKPDCIECLMFSLLPSRITCLVLYVPPGLTVKDHDSITDFLYSEIDAMLSENPDQFFIICGDFNDFPKFFLAENFYLVNKVTLPTRKSSLLDLIFMDECLAEMYAESAIIGPPLGQSDHNTVILNPKKSVTTNKEVRRVLVRDYRLSNLSNFTDCLTKMDFDLLDVDINVDDMCSHFYDMLNSAAATIPYEYVTITARDKPWITPLLKLLINKRWEAYRCQNWGLFAHHKEKVKREIIKAKRIWARENCITSKSAWNVVNSIRNKKKQNNLEGVLTSAGGIENLLASLSNEFRKNFNNDDDVPLKEILNEEFDICITEGMVYNKLRRLKSKKSAGPDNVTPRLLKEGAAWLCTPLAKIFNRSIAEKTFPTQWKTGRICPVPKKTNPTLKDFRPISLLSLLSKIFEQLVLDHMKDSLTSLYGPQQHAFRSLGSTTSALIDIVNSISLSLDSCETVAVHMYCLDLTKAFDKIHHNRLLNYLNDRGMNHGFLNWLQSYLSNRKVYVQINGVASPVFDVRSGVPQGTVLGPYLFASFMGFLLSKCCEAKIVVYADDVTIIEPICKTSVSHRKKIVSLISDMGLVINPDKCSQLCFKRSMCHRQCPEFISSKYVHILGFILNDVLSWDEQVSSIITKASLRLYIIRVLRQVLNVDELKTVYHALITSLFLYASPVYGRLPTKLMSKFERFQKRAHRIICGAGCQCHDFEPVKTRFETASVKYLRNIESHRKHPLSAIIPQRMKASKQFCLPQAKTERRLRTFVPYSCMLVNTVLQSDPSNFCV